MRYGGGLHCDVWLQEDAGPRQRGLQRAGQLLLLLLIGAAAALAAVAAAAAVRMRLLGNGAQREIRIVVASP